MGGDTGRRAASGNGRSGRTAQASNRGSASPGTEGEGARLATGTYSNMNLVGQQPNPSTGAAQSMVRGTETAIEALSREPASEIFGAAERMGLSGPFIDVDQAFDDIVDAMHSRLEDRITGYDRSQVGR